MCARRPGISFGQWDQESTFLFSHGKTELIHFPGKRHSMLRVAATSWLTGDACLIMCVKVFAHSAPHFHVVCTLISNIVPKGNVDASVSDVGGRSKGKKQKQPNSDSQTELRPPNTN